MVNNMVSIPHNQNDPKQLDCLAAQRYLYSRAKTYMVVQVILTIPSVIALSILTKLNPDMRLWNAFYGVAVLLIDSIYLDPYHRQLKREAANIQEEFDCTVLGIGWSVASAGSRPDPEAIHEASSKYKHNDPECAKLKDWYPKIDNRISEPLARLLCQRSNLWWDSKLRRRYAFWLAIIVGMVSVSVFVVSMWKEFTFEQFVLGGFCLLSPAWLWGVREIRRQLDSSNELDRLKTYLESVWAKAVKGQIEEEELKDQSREIQNALLERRQRNPLIFDWVYNRLRKSNERAMVKGTDALIEEALKMKE